MVVWRIYRRRVSRDWFPQSHSTPAESATPIPWSPAPARLPLAAAQWRAWDKPVVTVTSDPGNAKSRIVTLGMRMRASDPGIHANANLGTWGCECEHRILGIRMRTNYHVYHACVRCLKVYGLRITVYLINRMNHKLYIEIDVGYRATYNVIRTQH